MADCELVLVRHGETEWTERGLLHGARFDALYSSPQGRAMRTAEIIGRAAGLIPQPVAGLQEANFGWIEGKHLRRFDPDGTGDPAFRLFTHAVLALTAERLPAISRRVRAALSLITQNHAQGRALVVTHWRVLSQILTELVDGDPRGWQRYQPWAACGITELQMANGRWQIVRLDDRSHLQ